jgi:hypothetical protein
MTAPKTPDALAPVLAALGITATDLEDKLVQRLAELAFREVDFDAPLLFADDDEPPSTPDEIRASAFRRKLMDAVKARIDGAIDRIATEHIVPKVDLLVENLTIKQTNQFGEQRGEALSFVEYLTARADRWLLEEVDYNGRSQAECRSTGYSWHGKGTPRIVSLVDKHLQYSIQAMTDRALKDINSTIAGGLANAVKVALEDSVARLSKGAR